MEISLTLFKNIYDNKTNRNTNLKSFQDFEKVLYDLSNIQRKSKGEAELMSPAVYEKGTTRANANVIEWCGWCAVDVDDYKFDGELKDAILNHTRNWRFVCYSTASSTLDYPKFRLVFPLKRKISNKEIPRFNFALQNALGGIGDEQTKDLARMYYI